MNKATLGIVLVLVAAPLARAQSAASAPDKAAFERLKQLAGDWQGTVMTKDGPPAQVRYEVVSNQSAVMETLFPGTEHEMRSIYFMDGGSLVMTHYCAMGNQPHMKLQASASGPTELVFDFAGGTNMDPAKDTHIHSGKITLLDGDRVEAVWTVYQGTRQTGANRFFLTRKK